MGSCNMQITKREGKRWLDEKRKKKGGGGEASRFFLFDRNSINCRGRRGKWTGLAAPRNLIKFDWHDLQLPARERKRRDLLEIKRVIKRYELKNMILSHTYIFLRDIERTGWNRISKWAWDGHDHWPIKIANVYRVEQVWRFIPEIRINTKIDIHQKNIISHLLNYRLRIFRWSLNFIYYNYVNHFEYLSKNFPQTLFHFVSLHPIRIWISLDWNFYNT